MTGTSSGEKSQGKNLPESIPDASEAHNLEQ